MKVFFWLVHGCEVFPSMSVRSGNRFFVLDVLSQMLTGVKDMHDLPFAGLMQDLVCEASSSCV